ncbi:hypothetical protein ABE522_13260 [Stenotrophomonas pennii]|uniref:hypothetical protein n=1 Tax=Stenotrophomonas lacuserhaii TaxID=2760084 RepID=UPI003209B3AE
MKNRNSKAWQGFYRASVSRCNILIWAKVKRSSGSLRREELYARDESEPPYRADHDEQRVLSASGQDECGGHVMACRG